MPVSSRYRLATGMRWAARIIGLLAAGLCLLMLIASATGEVLTGAWETTSPSDIIQGSLLGVLGAIGLGGSILSWWRERLAVTLLLLTAAGFGTHIGLFAGHNHFLVWLVLGFPYLLAGVLLVIAGQLAEETP